jgi:hypothetical protein
MDNTTMSRANMNGFQNRKPMGNRITNYLSRTYRKIKNVFRKKPRNNNNRKNRNNGNSNYR